MKLKLKIVRYLDLPVVKIFDETFHRQVLELKRKCLKSPYVV